MHKPSLEDLISSAGGPLNLLRAHTYDRADAAPSCRGRRSFRRSRRSSPYGSARRGRGGSPFALFDQTHHMQGLFLEGPDAQRLLTSLACNDLSKSAPNSARRADLRQQERAADR